MALIKCPECGRENVSSNAAACPGCGFNIKDSFINNLESTDRTVNEDNDESAGGVTSVKAEANGDIHIKKSDSIKIGKKQLIICLGVVAAIIILILGIKIVIPEIRMGVTYNKANKLLADEKYDEASAMFVELGDYKDAYEKNQEAFYGKANKYFENGEYDKALKLYSSIISYADCKDKYDLVCIEKANSLAADGLCDDAIQSLGAVSENSNLSEEIKDCWYTIANAYITGGDYEAAISIYEANDDLDTIDSLKAEWLENQRKVVKDKINSETELDKYREEQQEQIKVLLSEYVAKIDSSEDIDDINKSGEEYLATLGDVKTDEQLKKEEELAERSKLTKDNIDQYIKLSISNSAVTYDPQYFDGVFYGSGAWTYCTITASSLQDVQYEDVVISFNIIAHGGDWNDRAPEPCQIKLSENGTGSAKDKLTTASIGAYPPSNPSFSIVITNVTGRLKLVE